MGGRPDANAEGISGRLAQSELTWARLPRGVPGGQKARKARRTKLGCLSAACWLFRAFTEITA